MELMPELERTRDADMSTGKIDIWDSKGIEGDSSLHWRSVFIVVAARGRHHSRSLRRLPSIYLLFHMGMLWELLLRDGSAFLYLGAVQRGKTAGREDSLLLQTAILYGGMNE